MSWRAVSIRVWLVELSMLVGLGVAFYLILGLGIKSSTTQELLKRQQTVVRAETSNIVSFFQVFGDSMAVLAQLATMENRDAKTVRDMDAFVEQWRASNLVGGVVITDKNGIVRFNSNVLGTHDVGSSLADRDYFLWAKNQKGEGEYFIGQPVVSRLGASKGQVIVPVAAAVFQKGVFTGAVIASVKLQSLTKRYLELMKVSDLTDVYLVNSRGELLYSSFNSDVMGTSILEHSPEIEGVLNTTKEGTLESGEHLIAYSPIATGSQNWLLIMASHREDAGNLAMPLYTRVLLMLLVVFSTVLLFGLVVTRETQKRLS